MHHHRTIFLFGDLFLILRGAVQRVIDKFTCHFGSEPLPTVDKFTCHLGSEPQTVRRQVCLSFEQKCIDKFACHLGSGCRGSLTGLLVILVVNRYRPLTSLLVIWVFPVKG